VARAVKQAGRGAHVDLKCEAAPKQVSTLYHDAFCKHHEAAAKTLGVEANPEAYAMVRVCLLCVCVLCTSRLPAVLLCLTHHCCRCLASQRTTHSMCRPQRTPRPTRRSDAAAA
jgi:hypothetical protein